MLIPHHANAYVVGPRITGYATKLVVIDGVAEFVFPLETVNAPVAGGDGALGQIMEDRVIVVAGLAQVGESVTGNGIRAWAELEVHRISVVVYRRGGNVQAGPVAVPYPATVVPLPFNLHRPGLGLHLQIHKRITE
ncbi:hypothetical protein [Endozoicomonas ascidiicola]|uniref:hypothetical protein n=1 Tax=Endozoicomonas ascidiicola TaxID=1698521 RepID=UPI001C129EA3|nr:hypothetical protein [Endozoicomonas ascidiicola]